MTTARRLGFWLALPWYVLAGAVYGGVTGALRGAANGAVAFALARERFVRRLAGREPAQLGGRP